MVDSEYNMGIYKSVKISIGAVTKNPEMLELVKSVENLFLNAIRLKKCVIKLLILILLQ